MIRATESMVRRRMTNRGFYDVEGVTRHENVADVAALSRE